MKLPVVLIGEMTPALTTLREQLARETNLDVHVRVETLAEGPEVLRRVSGPVLAILDVTRATDDAFSLVETIRLRLPDVHLLVTSADNTPDTILRAMRSGAEEFLPQPLDPQEVVQSLERMRRKVVARYTASPSNGAVITVFSGQGGVGVTTTATNLAVELAARQRSVCLVDLVLQFGAVTSFLNLDASYTILDLIHNLDRVDRWFLDGSLVSHPSGVRVLAEPFHAEEGARITGGDAERVLETLRQSFEFVVVDAPKGMDGTGFPALDQATLILFLVEMSVPSLKRAHRALKSFERLGIPVEKVRLVVNRYVKSKTMNLEMVEKALGLNAFWTLPNDYPTAADAVNQGAPIVQVNPRSKLARSYRELADRVAQETGIAPGRENQRKSKGIFGRLFATGR